MKKTFQYRLYPSPSQERALEATLETCRCFYNSLLAERKDAYQQEGRSVTKTEQLRRVKEEKASNPEAFIHSHVLQLVVADVEKAFAAFFRRVLAGEKPGYPRFKGYGRFASFGLKEVGNGFKVDGRRLKVSGIGRIGVRWHRPIEGTIKTVRITRKADGWYASFAVETEVSPIPETETMPGEAPGACSAGAEGVAGARQEQVVGVDVGIASLLTTSNGEHVQNPNWYRAQERKLRVASRRVCRRKKGGRNRRKAVRRLAKVHQRTHNRRKDFLNKVVHGLLMRYDAIAIEDLSVRNMVRNPHLSKSILDAGWGYLVSHLVFKAACAGKQVELVNPAYTSKTCSCCGEPFCEFTLAVRWVRCPCGLSMDRDENAAQNILNRSRFGQNRSASSLPLGGLAEEAVGL
jgi:putative transposase